MEKAKDTQTLNIPTLNPILQTFKSARCVLYKYRLATKHYNNNFHYKIDSKKLCCTWNTYCFGYSQCIKVLLLFDFVLQTLFTHLTLIYHGGTRWCHLALTFRRCSKSLKCIFSSPDDSGPMHSFASASLEVPRRLSLKTTHSIVECFNISLPMLKTRASFHEGLSVFRLVVVFFFFIRLFMYVNDTFTKGSKRRDRKNCFLHQTNRNRTSLPFDLTRNGNMPRLRTLVTMMILLLLQIPIETNLLKIEIY